MRPLAWLVAGVVCVMGLIGCGSKSDHDGEVVTPKAWVPPGGAAKFNTHGAPSKAAGDKDASPSAGAGSPKG